MNRKFNPVEPTVNIEVSPIYFSSGSAVWRFEETTRGRGATFESGSGSCQVEFTRSEGGQP